jgi:hypothetical protein
MHLESERQTLISYEIRMLLYIPLDELTTTLGLEISHPTSSA